MMFIEDFAFYEQLWWYYTLNRGKIRSRYNILTMYCTQNLENKIGGAAFMRKF